MAWKPDYITLAQAKSFMDTTNTTHDADITTAVTAASRAIDNHCNRQFGTVAAPVARVYTAWPNYERGVWVVDLDDLYDATGLTVTVAGTALTDFTLEDVNALADGKVYTSLVVNRTSAVQPCGTANEVSATSSKWGWSAFPVPVVQAAYLQTSRFANRRNSPYGVAGSPDVGSELRLLSKLDPDVAMSLRGLVRPRSAA